MATNKCPSPIDDQKVAERLLILGGRLALASGNNDSLAAEDFLEVSTRLFREHSTARTSFRSYLLSSVGILAPGSDRLAHRAIFDADWPELGVEVERLLALSHSPAVRQILGGVLAAEEPGISFMRSVVFDSFAASTPGGARSVDDARILLSASLFSFIAGDFEAYEMAVDDLIDAVQRDRLSRSDAVAVLEDLTSVWVSGASLHVLAKMMPVLCYEEIESSVLDHLERSQDPDLRNYFSSVLQLGFGHPRSC